MNLFCFSSHIFMMHILKLISNELSLGKYWIMFFGHPWAMQLPYLSKIEHLVCQEEHSKFRETDEVLLIQNTHSSPLLMHCLLLLSDYWIFSPDYVFQQSYPLLPSDHYQSLPRVTEHVLWHRGIASRAAPLLVMNKIPSLPWVPASRLHFPGPASGCLHVASHHN